MILAWLLAQLRGPSDVEIDGRRFVWDRPSGRFYALRRAAR